MDIKKKVAIITGGAKGLGREYARAILEKGGRVLITDLLEETGRRTQDEMRTQYGLDKVHFVRGDVSSEQDMSRVFEKCEEIYGQVDILVNNAGVGERNATIDKALAINIGGTIKCSRLALERMDKTLGGTGGVIVNISSIAGIGAHPGGTVYHACKHGVVGYSRCLGVTLEADGLDHGVKVVCLAPSYAKTDMTIYLQEAEQRGDNKACADLFNQGGWTQVEDIVAGCVKVIETEVPQASVIKISPRGSLYVYPDSVSGRPL